MICSRIAQVVINRSGIPWLSQALTCWQWSVSVPPMVATHLGPQLVGNAELFRLLQVAAFASQDHTRIGRERKVA